MSGVPLHSMAVYEENGNQPGRKVKRLVIKARPKWWPRWFWFWVIKNTVGVSK